jgi:hypothetical protein
MTVVRVSIAGTVVRESSLIHRRSRAAPEGRADACEGEFAAVMVNVALTPRDYESVCLMISMRPWAAVPPYLSTIRWRRQAPHRRDLRP